MIDTLIIVIVLAFPPLQPTPAEPGKENRFVEAFTEADRVFDRSYRRKEILSKLKQASDDAARLAWEETKAEREKILNFDDIRAIVEELERNSVKPKATNGNKR